MEKKCKAGLVWCPIKKQCVPVDKEKRHGKLQGRGQGEGPMGKPTPIQRRTQEAMDLVDVILKGDYETHKIVQEADDVTDVVLDEIENKIDTVPDQDLKALHSDVVDELTKDDGVSPVEEKIAISISRLIRNESYRDFFKKMLKKHNVSNPSELDDDKKKAFFNAVDKGWKAEDEGSEKKKSVNEDYGVSGSVIALLITLTGAYLALRNDRKFKEKKYMKCKNYKGIELKKCRKGIDIRVLKQERNELKKSKCKPNLSPKKKLMCEKLLAGMLTRVNTKIAKAEAEYKNIK